MKLIVGLGNPGLEYENTRHNIGFIYIDSIAKKLNLTFKENFNGLYAKTIIEGEEIIFLKPLSYMNLSGTVVIKYVNYYKINPKDVLVIHDDLDMEIAKIKLKETGSSGGHNGIKNIILNLQTENFKRLKVGIDKNKNIPTDKYVLGRFTSLEKQELENIETIIFNIINDYLKLPFNDLMSKYNSNNWRYKNEKTN